jgi:hypothetical protein
MPGRRHEHTDDCDLLTHSCAHDAISLRRSRPTCNLVATA